jgi:hypothetical protein
MKKQMIALAVAAAFALPALAQTSGRTTTDPKDSNPAAPPAAIGGAQAPAAGASAANGFSAMDRNNDGYISREEAKDATWSNRFSELDKDNDGRVSQSEFSAMGSSAGSTGTSTGGSTTGGMGGSVGPGGTQSGSSTSGVGDKPGQKQ